MANKKPKLRTESIGVRVPPKLRYGLELVARKKGLTLSEAMMRALEAYLENDGIGAKKPGEMFSPIDGIWSELEGRRICSLVEWDERLATAEEIAIANTINSLLQTVRDRGIVIVNRADSFRADSRLNRLLNDQEIEELLPMIKAVSEGKESFEALVDAVARMPNAVQRPAQVPQ